jgi:hypothetical protein
MGAGAEEPPLPRQPTIIKEATAVDANLKNLFISK